MPHDFVYNHAITLPARTGGPAQQHSQQQVPVRAQQLAAAASSYYQPALLPQQSTKKRHRKQAAPVYGVAVLSRNRRTYLGFGAALTSPT
jgi:hypothetical protein